MNMGKKNALGKRALTAALAVMLAAPVLPAAVAVPAAYAATVTEPTISAVGEEPVTAGVVLKKYEWSSVRSNTAVSTKLNVLAIDLQHPYVKLDVMTGRGGQFTTRQTVRGMAAETGAVAGVNGDFYQMTGEGVPLGGQISDGEIMSSPAFLAGMYAFALTKDNRPVIDLFTFQGAVVAANGASFPLAGVNQGVYTTTEGNKHSHHGELHLYTSDWGGKSRANDGYSTPTEVLVRNNVVIQISDGLALDMTPPEDGYILRASAKAADFVLANVQVGDIINASYQITAQDATKALDSSSLQLMIGGHTILVDNGQPTAFSRDVSGISGTGFAARTGIGYSADGRYVYLITAERSAVSRGMSLAEFQRAMVSLGVWKGMNLDGGGSTQLVSRPLGENDAALVNVPQDSTARQVVNGLGVYTTAPQGKLAGLIVQGMSTLFVNEQATFSMKAYDEYFNPLAMTVGEVQWTASSELGAFDGARFTALQPGKLTVSASSGGVAAQSREIEIIGGAQISGISFSPFGDTLEAGKSYKLPAVQAAFDGNVRTIPSELLRWELIGFSGVVRGDTVEVSAVKQGADLKLIARYGGLGVMLTQSARATRLFADFDAQTPDLLQTQKTPAEVVGEASLTAGLHADNPGNRALALNYNFSGGAGTKVLYASFGDAGVGIDGAPDQMEANVFGDGSLNWLRAEFVGADGKAHLVDLARPVDWSGWKAVSVDLSSYQMAYPIRLKRIYIASPEQGQDQRALVGTVAIDNIAFSGADEASDKKQALVNMAIGRTAVTVNGEEQRLDVAPKLLNETTVIPVRFFIDALGGDIGWNAEERRVTIVSGSHLVELWIGNNEIIVDGQKVLSPEAPLLENGRTLLPLRIISEALGWSVGWEESTKSITLQ